MKQVLLFVVIGAGFTVGAILLFPISDDAPTQTEEGVAEPAGLEVTVDLRPEDEIDRSGLAPENAASREPEERGLAYWQAKYRARLAGEPVVVMGNETHWVVDPEAVEAFQVAMQMELDAYSSQLVSPDEQHQAWFLQGDQQAVDRLDELQVGGQWGGMDEALIQGLLPDEKFAFSLMVAQVRDVESIAAYDSFADIPSHVNLFHIAPESIIRRFSPSASDQMVQQFEIQYRNILMEYLGAAGSFETLLRCSRKASRSIGLVSPGSSHLPDAWPEAGELRDELLLQHRRLRDTYLEIIRL